MVTGAVAAGCSTSPHLSAQATQRHTGTTTTRAASSTTSRPSSPGVLANCTAPAPQSLEVEPTAIFIACADAGIGAQDLVWHTWTATSATAAGEVWENDCTPNCASGTIKHYPASITLTGVQASRDGPTFTSLTATYSASEPNGRPTDTFTLEKPLG